MRNCFTCIVILMFPVLLSAGNITFMTYNLQNDNGLNFQSLRITRHAQVITASNADVVSVQEVNGNTNFNNLTENTYPSSAPTSLIDMILGFRKNPTDKQFNVVSAGIPVPPTGVVLKDISDHLPYCVTVNLTDEPGTGTDIPENNNIRIYTKDRTILIDAPDTPLDIKVYNLLGNIVREETGFGQHAISLEGIAGSVFIVKVNGRGVKVVVRF